MKKAEKLKNIGWILFALGWIPFTLAFCLGVEGNPPPTSPASIAMATAMTMLGLGFILLMGTMFVTAVGSSARNIHILETGRPATATIISAKETGTRINDRPLVNFVLEVSPEDEPAFQAETQMTISILTAPRVQPGSQVPVKYDPESKAVAIDLEQS